MLLSDFEAIYRCSRSSMGELSEICNEIKQKATRAMDAYRESVESGARELDRT